jgi:hypothetical protein
MGRGSWWHGVLGSLDWTIDKMNKDSTCTIRNSSTTKYEILLVFCSFLCVSLYVLVSFFFFSKEICIKMTKAH